MKVLKNYAEFSGRARRQEFWMYTLINFIIVIVLNVVDRFVTVPMVGFGVLGVLYALAVLIPGIAVAVRRLHDTGRTGWLLLIAFVPCIGAILLLIWYIEDSNPGSNEYGPNPKKEDPDQ